MGPRVGSTWLGRAFSGCFQLLGLSCDAFGCQWGLKLIWNGNLQRLLKAPLCLRSNIPSLPGCVAAGETDRSQILKNVRNAIRGRFPLYNLGFGHDLDFNFLEVMSMENNGWAQRIFEDHDATQQLQVSPPLPHTTTNVSWSLCGHLSTSLETIDIQS